MPVWIKRVSGLQRGSDDRSAAHKIAWYPAALTGPGKTAEPCDTSIARLGQLITQRNRIVSSLKQIRTFNKIRADLRQEFFSE